MGERIWTPWFIKFVHSRGYFNIYTNFLKERALSISHRDAGVNYGKSVGPDSTLLNKNNLDFNLWELQPLKKLKWYDFCFSEVLPGRIVRSFHELGSVLKSVQKQRTIVLISLYSIERRTTRNLICHLEKVGMQNYIFIDDDVELLADLAHRGYPVIDANELLWSIKMRSFQNSGDLVKEILVKSNVIKNCLDLGYNLWLVDGNMIPFSSTLTEPSDQSFDFFTAETVELMFVRNSQSSIKIWDGHFISTMAEKARFLISDGTISSERKNFLYILTRALENRVGLRLGKLDEQMVGTKLGLGSWNSTSLGGQKKMVFWPRNLALDSVQRKLQNTDLWLIDTDSSCNAVVCHQQ